MCACSYGWFAMFDILFVWICCLACVSVSAVFCRLSFVHDASGLCALRKDVTDSGSDMLTT